MENKEKEQKQIINKIKNEKNKINLNNINFEKSVSKISELPEEKDFEIVLVGKSNVGKSSFINSVFSRKKLAKTSNTPGKTRQINYYNLDNQIYIVDLPGYGYSKMSKEEELNISNKIEKYLEIRENISLILHILDIRHNPTEEDLLMFQYILRKNIPFIILCNKADKLSQSEIIKRIEEIKNILGISFSPIFPYTSNFKSKYMEKYREDVISEIEKILNGEI